MLIILLIWSLHVATGLEAKGYGGRKTMQKRTNSKTILRELGYDLSKVEKQHNKWRMTLADDRIIPGGPDPEHHSCPPALLCKAVGKVKCRKAPTPPLLMRVDANYSRIEVQYRTIFVTCYLSARRS